MLKQILSIIIVAGVMAAPMAAQAEIIDKSTIRPAHHHVHKHTKHKHHSYKHHHRMKHHHHAYKSAHHRTTSLPTRPNDRPNM